MIAAAEVAELAALWGVPPAQVERDYVLGWVLWGIFTQPELAAGLVLKGGNCLRKVYLPETRFSDDLDFSVRSAEVLSAVAPALPELAHRVGAASGIQFDVGQTYLQEKATPDPACQALDARLYFRGLTGRSSVSMRIKFDISEYERIALPLQRHLLQHPYSDWRACAADVTTYSLEEVLGEKLRSWIQRTRPRDLFDIVAILLSERVPVSRRNILAAFWEKTVYKQVPLAGREEMLAADKFRRVAAHWHSAMTVPRGRELPAGAAIARFRGFVGDLFAPALLRELGVAGAQQPPAYVPSAVREAIIEAAKVRHIIRLRYGGHERTIEPYSFRYRVDRRGAGAEYFYGFDRSRGQTIKSFFLNRIEGVSILPERFVPRWEVEF